LETKGLKLEVLSNFNPLFINALLYSNQIELQSREGPSSSVETSNLVEPSKSVSVFCCYWYVLITSCSFWKQ